MDRHLDVQLIARASREDRERKKQGDAKNTLIMYSVWQFFAEFWRMHLLYGMGLLAAVNANQLNASTSSNGVTGSNLWCYDCKEVYYKQYDPNNSPCLHNLSEIVVRQCGPHDRYCKVERLDINRQTMLIHRTCVTRCPYGCRFQGFGLTKMRCTSCCQSHGCNTDNASISVTASYSVFVLTLFPLVNMRTTE